MTTTLGRRYHNEHYNEIDARAEARGEARGQARGEAKAVLLVLQSRGVPVPDAVREQILTCLDTDQLELWLRRATTATTIEDVTRDH